MSGGGFDSTLPLLPNEKVDICPKCNTSNMQCKCLSSLDSMIPEDPMLGQNQNDTVLPYPQNQQQHTTTGTRAEDLVKQTTPKEETPEQIAFRKSYPLTNISEPTNNDCLCGRGNVITEHPGNKRYREIVYSQQTRYLNCKGNGGKSMVAMEIVTNWRAQYPPGRFLKLDGATKLWNDVGNKKARLKVSQALREYAPHLLDGNGKLKRRNKANAPKKSSSTLVSGDISKILSAEGDVQPPPPQIPGATSQNTSPLLGCPSISQGDMSMPTGVAAATKKNIKKTARSSSMLDEDQPSKKKRKKDPDAPKRPKTAYILYTSNEDNRARVKAANPDADFGAMAKLMTVEWQALSEDERARWDQLAAEDKKRFSREMEEYKMKQSLPQQERVKTAEDSVQPPPLPNIQHSPPATSQNVGMAQPPIPTMSTPSITNKQQQLVGPNREVVTPVTEQKNGQNTMFVPSNNKENSSTAERDEESVANLDRVRKMEEASRRDRRVMITDHYNQMKNKTATIVKKRVDSLIDCHTKDKTELLQSLKKKFDDKTEGIEEEIAVLTSMRTNATERGFKTTDIDERLSQETTKLNSINAEFESEKNEELDRLKNVYVGLYEATKKEFISLGTKQLPLSVIDNCSEKWKSYMESNNMVAV